LRIVWLLLLSATFALAQSPEPSPWKAPAEAAAKTNPLKKRPELAAGGEKIFSRMCAMCHEAGEKQSGPKLSSVDVEKETDGALFWKVSSGNSRTGMPSFSSLPDAQRWQLVLFIRTLAAKQR
jgi:mono/diheme cytochrome c family protein